MFRVFSHLSSRAREWHTHTHTQPTSCSVNVRTVCICLGEPFLCCVFFIYNTERKKTTKLLLRINWFKNNCNMFYCSSLNSKEVLNNSKRPKKTVWRSTHISNELKLRFFNTIMRSSSSVGKMVFGGHQWAQTFFGFREMGDGIWDRLNVVQQTWASLATLP